MIFEEQQKQEKMTPGIITLIAVTSFTSVDLQTHSLLATQLAAVVRALGL
jgi:hypothetical protein